eukprot:EG_transcript_55359
MTVRSFNPVHSPNPIHGHDQVDIKKPMGPPSPGSHQTKKPGSKPETSQHGEVLQHLGQDFSCLFLILDDLTCTRLQVEVVQILKPTRGFHHGPSGLFSMSLSSSSKCLNPTRGFVL